MAIRKIDTNIGTVPTWGDEDFDENVHENFTSLKDIVPKINNTVDDIDLAVNEMNILKNQAENVTTTASSSASLASQKASEANTSANQALTYKNQVMGYVVPAGASYSVEQINTQNVAMTKAQFNALAEERKANRAGSGWDEYGKHAIPSSTASVINEGMWVTNVDSNIIVMGRHQNYGGTGLSKSYSPIVNINGHRHKLASNLDQTVISLPTAPNIYPHDTVLTTEQIASGVIKHADASNSGLIVNGKFDTDTSGWTAVGSGTTFTWENGVGKLTTTSSFLYANQSFSTIVGKKYIVECNILSGTQAGVYAKSSTDATLGSRVGVSNGTVSFEFTATTSTTKLWLYNNGASTSTFDNIAVYPADAISRSDLVFLESFHEDISEKNFVYPLGNVQYLGGNTDGLTGIANGNFTGFETYSLFGNWQTPSGLIGKGYIWSNLTEAQKRAFIANPENNCYLDSDKTIQVRYRVRVAHGITDTGFNTYPYNNYFNNPSSGYVKPKGKQVSISSEWGVTDANGIYGHGTASWTANLPYANELGIFSATSSSGSTTGFIAGSYNGQCFALPIALIHRRNQGMYHPVYNPNGTKKASDGNFWYNTAVSFTSISDCFDPAKLLTASGYIGSVSGRPDGLFYDQIHESDITDLRNSSKKAEDYNRLISREFNKLVAGTTRGKEGEWYTYSYTGVFVDTSGFRTLTLPSTITLLNPSATPMVYLVNNTKSTNGAKRFFSETGWGGTESAYSDYTGKLLSNTMIYTTHAGHSVGDNVTVYVAVRTTRTKSNTLLHCDIIGNPSNYPTAWKQSGIFGTPLIVAEDGTSLLPDGVRDTFKLSRKANATPLLALRSTDNGATWSSFTPTFSTTTNEITLTNEPANNLVMVYYQTKTSMAVPVVNSEALETGEVLGTNGLANGALISTLIGKVPTANTAPYLQMGYDINGYRIDMSTFKFSTTATEIPTHSALSLAGGALGVPTVKVFPYLTRSNGKTYLNLIFKEMKHNGTSWGDDSKFNIVDNVSTTTDNNAQTILIGQKTVELPYFIAGDE